MGRFPFNKNSGLKFRKFHLPNGTVHSGCTDTPYASHRAFGYCSCKLDTKKRFWGQHFCRMERDISVRPTEMTRPVKEDHLQRWSWIYPSDQTEMIRSIWCTNRNFRNFGLNWKRPRCLLPIPFLPFSQPGLFYGHTFRYLSRSGLKLEWTTWKETKWSRRLIGPGRELRNVIGGDRRSPQS